MVKNSRGFDNKKIVNYEANEFMMKMEAAKKELNLYFRFAAPER